MTTSNVLATLAVVVALTGTSMVVAMAASPTLTGRHVVDGSLTTADVKDRSLGSTKFSSVTRTQLKAKVGPKGFTGPIGDTGPAGAQGRKGPRGIDAAKAYSYITADDTTAFINPKTSNWVNPRSAFTTCDGTSTLPSFLAPRLGCIDGTIHPHWAYDCVAGAGVLEDYCGIGETIGSAGSGATGLRSDRDGDGVIGFTGDANGSFVSLMGPGNILVNASLTFRKPRDQWHTRISCQPQIRRSNSSDQYVNLGVPTTVSSGETFELVHISVTGGAYFAAAGDYDYQVTCRMVDEYHDNSDVDDWFFIAGNATATTTEL